MTKTSVVLALLLSITLTANAARSQEAAKSPEDPAHAQLRELRSGLVAAVEKADLEAMLAYFDKDVVITWMNGEQSRGHNQIRDYYNRMMKGDKRIVERFSLENVEVADLTTLYGDDTGVAYGTARSHFVLTDGRSLDIDGPWTATLIKRDGKWLVAAFQASTNLFDNAVLKMAIDWIWKAAAIAGATGIIVGLVLMSMIKRTRPQPTGAQPA